MKVGEVRKIVGERLLGLGLGAIGFRRKGSGSLERTIPEGRQSASIAVYDYRPEFEFTLTLCVRLDRVEDHFHEALGTPDQYRVLSHTTMTPLAFLTGDGPSKFRATTGDEVRDAVERLGPLVSSGIVPFFERYRDVASLNEAVNARPQSGFDNAQLPWRAFHHAILAWCAGDPGLGAIVERYRGEMAGFVIPEKEMFDRLAARLGS